MTTAGPGIVPRWEWRTFGDLGPVHDEIAALVTGETQVSDELYVLSVHRDASVKVRDGLLDVKLLDAVGEDGLELWHPTLKAPFPVARDAVAELFEALGVAVPELRRDTYDLVQLREELVRLHADVRVAEVHKRRVRSTVDGCMVELTGFRVDGTPTPTVAVESPDPALVSATVRRLGLAGRRNTCVARGLKVALGWGRFAVVDVGTNSVKFHLGDRLGDGPDRTVVDRAEVTRLGDGLAEAGRLVDAAMARTADAIVGMVEEARGAGAADVVAVGTAGMRQAPNRDELVDRVRERCGVTIEVISGADEARLAYLAAVSSLPVGGRRVAVFDSGGGSSQFTFGESDRIDEQFSVDVGAVRFAERFGLMDAVPPETLESALTAIATDLGRLDGHPRPDGVVGIGGTATNLAAVRHGLAEYDPEVVQGTELDLAEIDRQIELYRTRSAEERRAIPGLQPARAEVILAGACVVRSILTALDQRSLTVSDRGLRHGVFAERFGGRRG